jgi:molybdopterin-containing oxidoreductase family membrane subunit
MRARTAKSYPERLEQISLAPLARTSPGYYILIFSLLAVIAWGFFAYITQLRYGLLMTGMRDIVPWGFYIFNFVFWIGVSHVGALISAILRLTNAGWRTPLTRLGELVTVAALIIGASMIIIDLGRPDRILNLIWYGRFQSPLVWDVIGVTTYLIGSFTYLYIPSIPDFALMRDRLGRGASALKRQGYTLLALGWRGTQEQRQRLDKAHKIMTVMIIPVAISVHTVVSFVFAMTLRPGWDSTILAPNFVIGALFSGMGALLIVMGVFRRFYHLEEYITPRHFRNMSHLVLVLLFAYFYFVLVEYLTVGYKFRIEELHLFTLLLVGKNAIWYWLFFFSAFVIPAFLILFQRGSIILRTVTAGILINVGMWVKRFVIIIPTLEVPLMPFEFEFATYIPSWVEISIIAAGFAGFALILALSTKIMPIMPFVELTEEAEASSHPGEEIRTTS